MSTVKLGLQPTIEFRPSSDKSNPGRRPLDTHRLRGTPGTHLISKIADFHVFYRTRRRAASLVQQADMSCFLLAE